MGNAGETNTPDSKDYPGYSWFKFVQLDQAKAYLLELMKFNGTLQQCHFQMKPTIDNMRRAIKALNFAMMVNNCKDGKL